MPQNNYALAVRLQQAALEQAKALQGLSQSSQAFPLEQRQRDLGIQRTSQQLSQSDQSFPLDQQRLSLGNQKTGQEISQAGQSFPLSQQQAFQTLGQGAADFRLRQQAGQLANENGIAAQYGADTGQILNTLAHRHLTRDPTTQMLAEAKPGDPVWAPNALSFYIEPKYVPGQNGLPGTTTPGRMAQITEQDAHSLLDAANARVQAQQQSQMQPQGGMQDASYQPGYGPNPRQNTGWGIFGNEGNAGDYHTFHLQDEATAAGMSPQGYLASILQRQMGGGGGAAPAMTGGFQMPPTTDALAAMHAERAQLQAMSNAPAQADAPAALPSVAPGSQISTPAASGDAFRSYLLSRAANGASNIGAWADRAGTNSVNGIGNAWDWMTGLLGETNRQVPPARSPW